MRRRPGAPRPRCVLDSGALSLLARGSERARAWLRWIVEHHGRVFVPTPILAESTTGDGGRDAAVNRILAVLERAASALVPPDEATARLAGKLRYSTASDDAIDALVAAAAIDDGTPCVLLTSDPDDLGRLLAAAPQVAVRQV